MFLFFYFMNAYGETDSAFLHMKISIYYKKLDFENKNHG